MSTSYPNLTTQNPSAPEPLPPKDELLTPEILFLNQSSTFRLTEAFAGLHNPTRIWQEMITSGALAPLYYRELEEKDEDVADAMEEMKLSVLTREMRVVPFDDSGSALDVAAFVELEIKKLTNWRNALDSILDAPYYGFSVNEMNFDVSMGQASLLDIKDCPQELFCFGPYYYPQIGPMRMKTIAGDLDGQIVPEQKFIIWSARMRSRNRCGRPLLRSVFWPSWFKRKVQTFWLRLAERGPGTAVVKYQMGADKDERNRALQAAEGLVRDVAMAIPENMQVMEDLLKMARSADPNTYSTLQSNLEDKIYRRIVGSTLTSHGSSEGKGTQALGNVHAQTKDERSVELTIQFEHILNTQLIKRLVLWNYGPDAPMPHIQFDKSDEEDLGQRITVEDTLQGMGLDIPENYARKRYGIPAPEADEPVLKRPVAPAPPSIETPAGTPARPAFVDQQTGRLVAMDQREYDLLLNQMQADGRRIYGERIKDAVDGTLAAHPGNLTGAS